MALVGALGLVLLLFAGEPVRGRQAMPWDLPGSVQWDQTHPASTTTPGDDDGFGAAIALGDFDANGSLDLAVGIPLKSVNCAGCEEGEVMVILRSSDGGWLPGGVTLSQDTPGAPGAAEQGDAFGSSLVVGDFNCDQVDDLAIGVPDETLGTMPAQPSAGAVSVFYGSASSGDRFVNGSQVLHQGATGVQGVVEAFDRFGESLASGDLDQDGCDELIVGVPREDYAFIMGNPEVDNAGVVHVFFGSALGLRTDNDLLLVSTPAIQLFGQELPEDLFGSAVAVLPREGLRPLLVVGEPGFSIGNPVNAVRVGALYAFVLDVDGLGFTTVNQVQGSFDHDELGTQIAVGNLGPETGRVVAAGVPHASRVDIFDGAVASKIETVNYPAPDCGGRVAFGDVDNNGRDDLFFRCADPGVPPGTLGPVVVPLFRDPGAFFVPCLETTGCYFNAVDTSADLGTSLAVGDVEGDGPAELFLGAAMHQDATSFANGVVFEFPTVFIFLDDFETGQADRWQPQP